MVLESVTFDGPLVGEDEVEGTPGSCTDLTENCIFFLEYKFYMFTLLACFKSPLFLPSPPLSSGACDVYWTIFRSFHIILWLLDVGFVSRSRCMKKEWSFWE